MTSQRGIKRLFLSLLVCGLMLLAGIAAMGNVSAVEAEVFSDSFDDGNYYGWTVNCKVGNTVTVTGGTLHIIKEQDVRGPARLTSNDIDLRYTADYWLQLKFLLPTGVAQNNMLIADDGRIYIKIMAEGSQSVLRFIGGDKTVDVPVTAGEWHFLRVMVYPHDGYYDAILDPWTSFASYSPRRYQPDIWVRDVEFRGEPLGTISVGTDAKVTRKHYGELYMDDIEYIGSFGSWNYVNNMNSNGLDGWSLIRYPDDIIEISTTYPFAYKLHVKYAPEYKAGIAIATSPAIQGDFSQDHELQFSYIHTAGNYMVIIDTGQVRLVDKSCTLYYVRNGVEYAFTTIQSGVSYIFNIDVYPESDYFRITVSTHVGTYPLNSKEPTIGFSLGSSENPTFSQTGEAYWDSFYFNGISTVMDTDGDGYSDSLETSWGTDPYGCDRWAIVVTGGYGDAIQGLFEEATDFYYRSLKAIGYTDSHIKYLTSSASVDLTRDADADGVNDIDGISTLANFDSALTSWVHTYSDRDDTVIICLKDHGLVQNPDLTAGMVIDVGGYLYEDHLDSLLDSLEQNGDFGNLILLINCCYSGNWLVGDENVVGNSRLVLASTLPGESGGGFGVWVFNELAKGYSVEDAYWTAWSILSGSTSMSDNCNPGSNPYRNIYA